MNGFIFCLTALICVGCASSTPQTETLLLNSRDLPKSSQIAGVPFIRQTANYCGPATLTMALKWAGKNVTIDEVAAQVYTPGMRGSLQSDMISASRRQGALAIPIEGMTALLKEVSAGNPVIVFENLSLSWWPQWHYAVIFGYNLFQQKILMHSGPEAFKQWDLRKFERSWKLGHYWGLVVLPPGLLAASAGELEHVRATAALEKLGKLKEATKSYQSILQLWPQSLGANIGLANIAFSKNEVIEAVQFLRKATEDHPQSAAAWHNLAIAQRAALMKRAARQSALRAIALASSDEKFSYNQDLQEIL